MKIPEGYQTITPYLILKNATIFLEFASKVFDAQEKMKVLADDGRIMHAEIIIGSSIVMIGESTEEWQPQNAGLYIYVADADKTYKKALKEGAISVMEPIDKDYGRSGGVKDPCGNTWWLVSV